MRLIYLLGEFDKVFQEGDTAWVLFEKNNNDIIFRNMADYYRIDKELLLIGVFMISMIRLSGFTRVRIILSFGFALLSIFKILIPLMLKGDHPLVVALIVGNIITVMTLLLVAGINEKAYAVILSSVICSLVTSLLAQLFGNLFQIHGAVME